MTVADREVKVLLKDTTGTVCYQVDSIYGKRHHNEKIAIFTNIESTCFVS